VHKLGAMSSAGLTWKAKAAGGAPTLEEHLDHCGLGRYQAMIFCMASVLVVADGSNPLDTVSLRPLRLHR